MRVHLLFLDESGQLDQRGLFALGGVAIRDSDWSILRDLWHETLTEQHWPLEREVKWHRIRTGEVPPALADAVVATLGRAPITCYVTLLDLREGPVMFPPETYDYFRSPEDSYSTALMFLAERFHHLLAAEEDVGLIVVDSRFREQDTRLRRFFADLTEAGTPYMKLMDGQGDLHVIELKKDRTPREVVAQTLEYGFWVQSLSFEAIRELYAKHHQGEDFDSAFTTHFEADLPEAINNSHHLVVVATGMDISTEQIVEYVRDYGVPINVLFFEYLRTVIGSTWRARGWPTPSSRHQWRVGQEAGPVERHGLLRRGRRERASQLG